MTRSAPYEKSKCLGSRGSMVARLKLKEIDGRAPPGVKDRSRSAPESSRETGPVGPWPGGPNDASQPPLATLSNCGKSLKPTETKRAPKGRLVAGPAAQGMVKHRSDEHNG